MKLYTCTDHDEHWPVGVASIVLAHDEDEARRLLDEQLTKRGLKGHADEPYTLTEVPQDQTQAIILRDGNY